MQRTSTRNPPSTNYQRPTERKFFIWRDRCLEHDERYMQKYNLERAPWRWCCTFCDPPSYGFRSKLGAWQAIINTSMPRHFFVRHYHHQHAARRSHG